MKDKKNNSVVNIGLSSLLLVFLVLCLTTFALLSLSSAKSDYSLSEKLAQHRSDYYTASSQAEEMLAKIDQIMDSTYHSSDAGDYIPALTKALETESVTVDSENGMSIISYQIPVDDSQILSVRLKIIDPSTSENYYEILTWQVRNERE